MVKNLPTSAGDMRDEDSVPGLGRSLGGVHDNPFQYSCLENPMDGGAWQATIHGVTNSQTPLSNFTCFHLEMSRESEMGAHGEKYC